MDKRVCQSHSMLQCKPKFLHQTTDSDCTAPRYPTP